MRTARTARGQAQAGLLTGQGHNQHPDEGGEGGHLGARAHEGGDRRGRALVDIRRPHVEGDEADLEAEAHEEQGHPRQKQGGVPGPGGQGFGDGGEVGAAACAVEQGRAIDEEGAGKGPQQEVFHAGFHAAGVLSVDAGQNVEAQGEDLQGQEDHDQIRGAAHGHHAGGAEEEQGVEFADLGGELGHVADAEQNGQGRGGQDHQTSAKGEVVRDGRGLEEGGAGLLPDPNSADDCGCHPGQSEPRKGTGDGIIVAGLIGRASKKIRHHHHQGGDDQQGFGQDGLYVDAKNLGMS